MKADAPSMVKTTNLIAMILLNVIIEVLRNWVRQAVSLAGYNIVQMSTWFQASVQIENMKCDRVLNLELCPWLEI